MYSSIEVYRAKGCMTKDVRMTEGCMTDGGKAAEKKAAGQKVGCSKEGCREKGCIPEDGKFKEGR
jgi:hypothetical protein